MKIELLHIAGCPNVQTARTLLKKILQSLGLPEEIEEIEVRDSSHAEALNFLGSPTIRVDDRDVEATLPQQTSCGLSCRMYVTDGELRGAPTQEMVWKAIRLAMPQGSDGGY